VVAEVSKDATLKDALEPGAVPGLEEGRHPARIVYWGLEVDRLSPHHQAASRPRASHRTIRTSDAVSKTRRPAAVANDGAQV